MKKFKDRYGIRQVSTGAVCAKRGSAHDVFQKFFDEGKYDRIEMGTSYLDIWDMFFAGSSPRYEMVKKNQTQRYWTAMRIDRFEDIEYIVA